MEKKKEDALYEGKDKYFMDIDRMTNEGLGGGYVTSDNALIENATEMPKNEEEPKLNEKN